MTYNQYQRAYRRSFPFSDVLDEIVDSSLASLAQAASGSSFKMNVEDTGTGYLITAELPGVKRDQIDVELNEGRLSIAVQKTEPEDAQEKTYLVRELGSWSATRGVYLKDASLAGLTAKLEDGVLTVVVPKQEEKVNITKITVE